MPGSHKMNNLINTFHQFLENKKLAYLSISLQSDAARHLLDIVKVKAI